MNGTFVASKRKALIELLQEFAESLVNYFPDVSEKVSLLSQKVSNEQFNLVVLGQFKRGKSTLINALVGDNILPTAVVPLTSVITILKGSSVEKITVYFAHGGWSEISRDELPEFVTERLNPNNVKQVERVEIELPANFLKNGIHLIDTPGVGSIYSHNTDVSYHFLPNSDASIFLLTADQPLSIAEVEFLRSVRAYVDKIFFVLNKIDMLSETEQNDAVVFIVDSLAKELYADTALEMRSRIRLFPISARAGLNAKLSRDEMAYKRSGVADLEIALLDFLADEKGELILQNASKRARQLANELTLLIELQRKSYKEPLERLQKKIEKFRAFAKEVHQQEEEILDLLSAAQRKIIKMLDDDMSDFETASQPKVLALLDAVAVQSKSFKPSDFAAELNKAIVDIVTSTVEEWRLDEETKIKNIFNSQALELLKRMSALVDDIYQTSADLFEVNFKRMERGEIFSDETQFYYMILQDIKPSLEEVTEAIVKKLPKRIAQGLIYRKAKETLTIELDRQCGRIRYDFVQRLDKSVLHLRQLLSESVATHLAKIETIISEALVLREKSSAEVQDKIKDLEMLLSTIEGFDKRLAQFFP